MEHIGLAVRGSQRIEAFLKENFGAEGKGLHEILSSVEEEIPEKTVKRARYVASVRNRVVHEAADIDDLDAFSECVESVLEELEVIIDEREAARRAEKEHLAVGGVRMGRGDGFGDDDPIVVITRTPFWAKIAIPVLALAALLPYVSLSDKTETIDHVYDRVNAAESAPSQSSIDADALTRSQRTVASQEATIIKLRKQLKEAREEAEKAQEAANSEANATRTPPTATTSSRASVALRDAQSKLNALGYDAGVPDGLMGPGTRRALISFQQQNGLSQTGKLGSATSAALSSTHAKAAVLPAANGSRSVNLLAAAQTTQNDTQSGYTAIDEGVRNILSRASVEIGKVDVQSGNVQVQVGWSIDVSAINELLKDHLKIRSAGGDLEIRRYGQDEHRSYSPSLLSSLRKKSAYLVVKVGPKMGRLRIGGDASCHVRCELSSSFGLNSFYLDGSQSVGGVYPKVINVEGLSSTDLAAVHQVTGWIEWI